MSFGTRSGGGSEQGLEEGPAFLAIAREQRSDTPEQGAFGPIGERPDEIGEDLALGLEPDDRVRVEGLTDGHLVRQRLRDGPMLADAFVQVLELRAQCGPMGLGSVGRGKPGVGIGLVQPVPVPGSAPRVPSRVFCAADWEPDVGGSAASVA